MTPDPYKASAGAPDPSSWNRYAYVGGDPVNFNDPHGLYACIAGYDSDGVPDWTECEDETSYVPGYDPNSGCATVTSPDDPAWQQCFGTAPDTQGTSKQKQINVSKYQTSGAKARAVQNALRRLKAALPNDPTCDSWLTNGDVNASTAIDLALGNFPGTNFQTGVGDFSDPAVNAVFSNTGTNLGSNAFITINANGAYFSSSVSVGVGVTGITGGTAAAQALILIHELAHAVGAAGFLDDDSDPTPQAINNALVLKNCQKTIDSFGKL